MNGREDERLIAAVVGTRTGTVVTASVFVVTLHLSGPARVDGMQTELRSIGQSIAHIEGRLCVQVAPPGEKPK